ncbi:MAG: sigma-54-dependent Fis family transcriptional regulator [Deltaproteobacteria bacterium]|nr:MAG: sigma-54-dependent Fis family transcriptional regulator [Deltaproteobacteria bacterium]
MAHVLVIDDNETMREGMAITLKKAGHEVTTAASGAAGIEAFKKSPADFVITDLKMEPMDGIAVLEALREIDPHVTTMVVTAFGTIETAVEAMKLGAFDFLTKPFTPDVLRAKVAKGLEVAGMKRQVETLAAQNEALRDQVDERFAGEIVGESEKMKAVFETIRKVASTDASVHIHGESGTGKELVARALHKLSPRRDGPFVKVNCGALTETLLESELFGHEKGAFTGAIKRKLGRFELAHGGTIFLDEIGDVSPNLQLKLLRVLQEREFERVGGEQTLKVDVRVISATHRDLKQEVEEGRFREDLYYRLHVVPIVLPPLRERGDDVLLLARHFAATIGERMGRRARTFSEEAEQLLLKYPWPGNVRELENVVEQALVFAEGDRIEVEDLPAFLKERPRGDLLALPTGNVPLPEILEDLERQLIERAYEKAKGVKTETARLLGIKTSALYYKLDKYGIGDRGKTPASGDG